MLNYGYTSDIKRRRYNLNFYYIVEPCCALKYYPEIEICVKEQKGEQEAKRKEAQRLEDENFGTHIVGRVRTYLWNLMEYPETSKAAQVGTQTFLLKVLLSSYYDNVINNLKISIKSGEFVG